MNTRRRGHQMFCHNADGRAVRPSRPRLKWRVSPGPACSTPGAPKQRAAGLQGPYRVPGRPRAGLVSKKKGKSGFQPDDERHASRSATRPRAAQTHMSQRQIKLRLCRWKAGSHFGSGHCLPTKARHGTGPEARRPGTDERQPPGPVSENSSTARASPLPEEEEARCRSARTTEKPVARFGGDQGQAEQAEQGEKAGQKSPRPYAPGISGLDQHGPDRRAPARGSRESQRQGARRFPADTRAGPSAGAPAASAAGRAEFARPGRTGRPRWQEQAYDRQGAGHSQRPGAGPPTLLRAETKPVQCHCAARQTDQPAPAQRSHAAGRAQDPTGPGPRAREQDQGRRAPEGVIRKAQPERQSACQAQERNPDAGFGTAAVARARRVACSALSPARPACAALSAGSMRRHDGSASCRRPAP